jgi:hypothetical protein
LPPAAFQRLRIREVKMKKLLLISTCAVMSLGISTAASAANCKAKDLKGAWIGKISGEVENFCLIQFNGSAKISKANCFTTENLHSLGTLKGRLKVTKACEVSGDLIQVPPAGVPIEVSVSGQLDPKLGVMNGEFVVGDEALPFLLVRQWK